MSWAEVGGFFALETREQARLERLRRLQWVDVLLVVAVAVFLVRSYLFCRLYRRCCLHQRGRHDAAKMARVPQAALLVTGMEEPLLGPSDYEQPPHFELSPPAYDYLPSAPPLSSGSERATSP